MWNPDMVSVSVQEFSNQLFHCLVTTLDRNYETYTTFVYASPRIHEARELWSSLERIDLE